MDIELEEVIPRFVYPYDTDVSTEPYDECDVTELDDVKNASNTIKKQFTDHRHVACRVEMDENYVKHQTPIGFKTKLLVHQQTVLAAMLDLEKKRVVNLHMDNLYKYETCAGLLSEKFGSGKTIMILSLIVASPIPDNRHIYQVCRFNGRPGRICDTTPSFVIKKKFQQDRILRPALLFVASSVVMQWVKAVKDFTDINMLTVANVYDMRTLYTHIIEGTINKYDVVLVKNGNITGEFNIHGHVENKNMRKQRKIYNIISNITRQYCWSRVILDDYDIIKLPRPTSFMNGLFTWFISATTFRPDSKIGDVGGYENILDSLKYHNIDLRHISKSPCLGIVLNICNKEQFTEDSVSVGKPLFWTHVLVNKNKKYVQMIGVMAGDKINDIMEMLNGDAIGTAAECAGIKSDNITDIFKKILQDQYDRYSLSTNTLLWIDTLDIEGFDHLSEPKEDDVYYQKHVYEQRPIDYNYPDIKGKVEAVRNACIADKTESGIAIDRVKDNIKDGDCPVCCCDLHDEDAIIVKCCGKILCAECGIQGTNLSRHMNAITGKCPNCRTIIGFTDLIFINGEFNLDDIITDKPMVQNNEEKKPIVDDVKKDKTKFDILIDIINNVAMHNKKNVNVTINGMLEGIKELPEAPAEHRKIIIFSKFDESLSGLENNMKKAGIAYKRLGGTTTQIHDTAVEFQDSYDGINVLLINGEKYASGLNLQSTTDLVFMHKIIDRNIESQIIGRIQRLGRVYKAHVHYLLYDDEIRYMDFA